MHRLADLKKEAEEKASLLGHKLNAWSDTRFFGGSSYTYCTRCPCWASVMVTPPLGQNLIGGTATEEKCNARGVNDEDD